MKALEKNDRRECVSQIKILQAGAVNTAKSDKAVTAEGIILEILDETRWTNKSGVFIREEESEMTAMRIIDFAGVSLKFNHLEVRH